MAFQKGRKRTGGRAQGTLNKTTLGAKQAFQYAFEKIGGADNLAKWAQKHPLEFYKLYARMNSAQVVVDIDQALAEKLKYIFEPLEGKEKEATERAWLKHLTKYQPKETNG